MFSRILTAFAVLAVIFLSASWAGAETTSLTVMVKSKDAKFVGTSMGGVLITVRDADTEEVLDSGVTAGGTGDTSLIMRTPRERGRAMATDGAARFTAEVDIDEPTLVEVSAFGPLAQRQSAARASVTQWVIPGRDVTRGDALTLELPGFVVDVLAPGAASGVAGDSVTIEANVTMMCGCPITPGGLWDSDGFEITAIVKRNGRVVGEMPLEYAGRPSTFSGAYQVPGKGTYEVVVFAFDPDNGNAGVDRTTFSVG